MVPAPLLKWPEQGSDYVILVDKSIQKVFLYHKNHPFGPVKTYAASTGENDGPKTRQNDKKTPEGIYFFTKSYVERELAPIYGPRAFPLNYPNPIDKMEGRKGYGIWFHGLNKPLKPKDTNGCIALNNRNIDDLAGYITLNDTPVVISSRIEKVDPEKLKKEAEGLEKIIEGWRRAWEGKDVDRYISYYHRYFTAGHKDRKAWRNYKARLAKKYRKIKVDIDNLRILKNNGIVLAEFTQRYSAPGFKSEGKKRLYLAQNSRHWKIIGEYFQEGSFNPVVAKKPAPKLKPKPEDEIRTFLYAWKNAWEKKEIEAYIACYDRTFRSRGMGIRAWKRHRERLNRKNRSFNIEIEDIKISEVSKNSAQIRFRQHYRADHYQDQGFKEIRLIKRGGKWKIKEEDWRPM